MSYAKDRVSIDLELAQNELKKGVGFIDTDDSLIASVELINNYQNKRSYNAILLDEEKKYILNDLLDKVKISLNSIIKIYDNKEELICYIYKDEKGYRENFLSYENSKKVLFSKYEHEKDYVKQEYFESEFAPFKHINYYSQPELSDKTVVTYHFMNNKIYVRTHHSVFYKEDKTKTLLHMEMSKAFDGSYFDMVSKQLNINVSIEESQNQKLHGLNIFDNFILEDKDIMDKQNNYLTVYLIKSQEGNANILFSLDKAMLNSALSQNRKQLCFFLSVSVVLIFIFFHFFIYFRISKPIDKIMKQITKVKHGDYGQSDVVKTGDELQEISSNINMLAKAVSSRENSLTESQKELERLSTHDELTGLLNRRSFNVNLKYVLRKAKRNKTKVAILFLDLDQFKQINDTLGHSVGDQLLMSVSNRLRYALRDSDVLARVGGDEFNVFVDGFKNVIEIQALAQKLLDAFEEPFTDSENEIVSSTSIGIAIFPEDGADSETLIKNSDLAMYMAKEKGRNNYSFYASKFSKRLQERMDIVRMLKQAVKNKDEFLLLYQPKISITSGKIVGAEALIRWNSPEMGFMSPDAFIPIAEETHMIIDIGAWVVKKACEDFMALKSAGDMMHLLSVNVSGVQLQYGDMLQTVKEAISSSGISSSELELEVTESYISSNEKNAIETLKKFRSLGIELAIDDFGTGYSSMSYLQKLPITRLKIDKSFVDDLPESEGSVALVDAVLSLAEAFHLNVTVEGVETQKQLDFFKDKKCDDIQGYFYSKPLPFDELKKFIKDNAV